MINKKEFKTLEIQKQVELVNQELIESKGTKNFGNFNLNFSYGFARNILIAEGYDTLEEVIVDNTKIKLFRKMSEEEMLVKEEKIKLKEDIIEENNISMKIAKDIYDRNLNIEKDKKTISKTIPIFEDTYIEFQELLNSNEFKLYDKKYIIELMIRNFINDYKN